MVSFSQIIQKLKEVFSKMVKGKSIEREIGVSPLISNQMANAIQLWEDMYKGQSPWIHEPTFNDPTRVVSLGLPQMIASEKARTALLEFKSEITTPMKEVEVESEANNAIERFNESLDFEKNSQNSEANQPQGGVRTPMFHPKNTVKELVPKGPTERAEYLNKIYQCKILPKLRREIEYGIALGGLVIKPYVIVNEPVEVEEAGDNVLTLNTKIDKAEMEFDFVYADHFYPLAFNGSGDITEAAFIEHKVDKNITYSRLEHHKYISSTHQVMVTNKAFKSTANVQANEGVDLGEEISLKQVPDWEGIQPLVVINNADRLMFAYFKMPEANTIDMYSPLGVSGFDKAIKLIKDADYQYSRLLWEYEAGEMAIDIDRDALKDTEVRDNNGNLIMVSKMGHMQQRLYRPVVLDNGNGSDTYQPYAPALRDASFINGLNTILTHIEDVTGLSRGTLSEVTMSEARTATELRILKQRSYQTNADIQKAIQRCLEDLVYVMNALCSLYKITKEGEYEVSFEWDDSILVNANEELGTRMALMQNGIMSKEELRMWYMGETERQAKEALLKVQEENRLAVEDNLMTQMEFRDNGMDSSMQQKPDSFRQPTEDNE